jgi:hypothetical protein
MIAYEFYSRDAEDQFHLIGILPERRGHSGRITQQSVLNWGKEILGTEAGLTQFFFVRVKVYEDTGEIVPMPRS